ALSGRQDIVIQQKSHEVQQQIQSEEFRRDFAKAWHEFENKPSGKQDRSDEEYFQKKQAEREAKIVQLHKENDALSQDMEVMFIQMKKDIHDMRETLKEIEGR